MKKTPLGTKVIINSKHLLSTLSVIIPLHSIPLIPGNSNRVNISNSKNSLAPFLRVTHCTQLKASLYIDILELRISRKSRKLLKGIFVKCKKAELLHLTWLLELDLLIVLCVFISKLLQYSKWHVPDMTRLARWRSPNKSNTFIVERCCCCLWDFAGYADLYYFTVW